MLGTVVGMGRGGAPVYLRDVFDVRRMYESPIPYKVDVLGRTGATGPLDTRRAVMVAVEMRDGKIIRHFNEDVKKVVEAMKARMPEGLEFRVLSDQPTAV
jgi:multidrug efflux pump subunit AcrB